MTEPVRIAINAQIKPNKGCGGAEQGLIGLVTALGKLDDSPEEYVIIGHWQEPDWLKRFLGANQSIVSGPKPHHQEARRKTGLLEQLKRAFGPLRPLVRSLWRGLFPALPPQPQPPSLFPEVSVSDGFYENLGCDVIHLPIQHLVLCALPSIYNPHDLQHVHYPEFFKPSEVTRREIIYRAGCHLANSVVVHSQWVKHDVVSHYRVDPDKVQVIPWAPATQVYPASSESMMASVQEKYQLQIPFAYYPAMTWEHKNHLRLLEALAYLRDREGLIVRLVCTGKRYPDFWPRVEERLQALKLHDQVQFLGMVRPTDLRAMYRLSQFVVFPSLFEGGAIPMFEAWLEATPLACSTATMLPEHAGDAALLFDPHCIPAIADAIGRMATDANLRAELVRKGQQRLQDFSWERTAKAYRAIYRRAAGRPLTEEDRWILSHDWMQNPPRSKKNE
jgi:glycosyltransferase involved in cell wall biosynthesis